MHIRVVIFYCLIIYALSWSLQFAAIYATGGNLESDAAKPWLAGVMFGPALVALLFVWRIPSTRGALKWKPTWRMWPAFAVAVAVPTLIAFGIVAACELTGWGAAGWFVFTRDGVAVSGGP